MNDDIWPYGFAANRTVIEAMRRWSQNDGQPHGQRVVCAGAAEDLNAFLVGEYGIFTLWVLAALRRFVDLGNVANFQYKMV